MTVASVDVDSVENGYPVLNRELGLPAKPMQPSAFVSVRVDAKPAKGDSSPDP